jgi:hypothetical protein
MKQHKNNNAKLFFFFQPGTSAGQAFALQRRPWVVPEWEFHLCQPLLLWTQVQCF